MNLPSPLTTPLPELRLFSQASLQDYVDCRRRYYLRHLLRLAWPAIAADPVQDFEKTLIQGARFHRLVQQALLGISTDQLERFARQAGLSRWWDNFLLAQDGLDLMNPYARRYPEIALTAPLGGARLIAQCDLVLILPENMAVIFDWKTSKTQPRRDRLANRLQTRVYPFLLAHSGAFLNQGIPIPAGQIEMVYWFAENPHQPHRFRYSQTQYQADGEYLRALVAEILSTPPDQFYQTSQVDHCRFCSYRSLCERGVAAGDLAEVEWPGDPDLSDAAQIDFDQIAEIPF